jgi:mRNA interferase MazF
MGMPDPGDVVWLQFPGAVVTKRRPAIVLSSAAYHAARPDVLVGLVTSQTAKAKSAMDHAIVDWSSAGLRVLSSFRVYLATLPQSSIISKMGRLSVADWQAVQDCVKRAMALT